MGAAAPKPPLAIPPLSKLRGILALLVTGNRVDCLYRGEEEARVSRLVADLTLSREKLGYRPKTSLTEGLRLTVMRDPRFSAA